MAYKADGTILVSDAIDLIRQAYENCAVMVETFGADDDTAHHIRKQILKIKVEPGKEEGKLTFSLPTYEKD